MANGYFCVHDGTQTNWVVCVPGGVTTRSPRQYLTVDAYEAATPEQRAEYDLSLSGVNVIYSLVDHTAPEEEDEI